MILGDDKQTFGPFCQDNKIKYNQEEKVLEVTIDNKLNFTSHVKKLTKKANQKLHALTRVRHYMDCDKNKLRFSSFVKSQFRYCPLIWMFYPKLSIGRINNVHDKSLRLISRNYDTNFDKLLETCSEISTHQACINLLTTEVYKYLHGLSPLTINDIFTLHQNSYNLRNCQLIECANPRTVRLDAIAYRANQLWKKVSNHIKASSSLELFKRRTKLWNCKDCPCNICRPYVSSSGYISSITNGFFF